MKTIYKYPINDPREHPGTLVALPSEATILSVGEDPSGRLCLWALVDTDNDIDAVEVWVVGTGQEIPKTPLRFMSTVNVGKFVWHIFIRVGARSEGEAKPKEGPVKQDPKPINDFELFINGMKTAISDWESCRQATVDKEALKTGWGAGYLRTRRMLADRHFEYPLKGEG